MNLLQLFFHMSHSEVSFGGSLSSVSIHDSRHGTPIDSAFTTPFLFGGMAKPAVSAIVSFKSIKEWKEGSLTLQESMGVDGPHLESVSSAMNMDSSTSMNSTGNVDSPANAQPPSPTNTQPPSPTNTQPPSPTNTQPPANDLRVSVHVGTLRILPTPWILSVLELADTLKSSIERELGVLPSTKMPTVDTTKLLAVRETGTRISIDLRVDNPSIFLVEDTRVATSPSFLVSLSMDATVSISPQLNVDATLCVTNVRGCRASPLQDKLPEPSMIDVIHPFDVNVNLHATERLHTISATVITSKFVSARLGLKDLLLMQRAVESLLSCRSAPSGRASSQKPCLPKRSLVSDDLHFTHLLHFYGGVSCLSVVVVNDTNDTELPILHMAVRDTSVSVEMTEDLLQGTAELAVEADSYFASHSAWEPVLEPWSVKGKVMMEPRGRILQRLSASSKTCEQAENAISRLSILCPTPLNLNVTPTLLSSILNAIHDFRKCRSTVHDNGDNYFIGIRNFTGLEASFCVEDDGGLQTLDAESAEMQAEERSETALFAGVAMLALGGRKESCWTEVYGSSPHLRVFRSVPFVRDAKRLWLSSDVWKLLEGTAGWLLPVCSFVDQREGDVQLYVGDERQQSLWRVFLRSSLETPDVRLPSGKRGSGIQRLSPSGELVVTSLPAYPSLSLLYYHQPYRRLPERQVLLRVGDFAPVSYPVDRVKTTCVALEREGRSVVVALTQSFERGRKVLTLSAPVRLTNATEFSQRCGVGESGERLVLAPGESLWCDVSVATEGLFVGPSEEERAISMARIRENKAKGLLRLGATYVMMEETLRAVPLLGTAETVSMYELTLTSMLTVENLLPEPLEYCVVTANGQVIPGEVVKPGGHHAVTNCRFARQDGCRVSVRLVNTRSRFNTYASSIPVGVSFSMSPS